MVDDDAVPMPFGLEHLGFIILHPLHTRVIAMPLERKRSGNPMHPGKNAPRTGIATGPQFLHQFQPVSLIAQGNEEARRRRR